MIFSSICSAEREPVEHAWCAQFCVNRPISEEKGTGLRCCRFSVDSLVSHTCAFELLQISVDTLDMLDEFSVDSLVDSLFNLFQVFGGFLGGFLGGVVADFRWIPWWIPCLSCCRFRWTP